jgi:hypothetical protein
MTAQAECTIVVMPRDRFSTTSACLDSILENTPGPFELKALLGGAPAHLKARWLERYAGRVDFTFLPDFKNGAELRNLALRTIRTPLAVFLDTDVYVRPNWLDPLLQCQRETGADLVVPVVLDRNDLIHTAGNDFFITYRNGQAYGIMELRYAHHPVYSGGTNLKRQDIAFGEIHCHLVVAATAAKLGIYDERLREGHEIDSGLTLSRHGRRMMFEPRSMVYLTYPEQLDDIDDVSIYVWKWDMPAMLEGWDYFKKKWNIDVNPDGRYERYLRDVVNTRVGRWTRRWPSRFSIAVDRARRRLRGALVGR